MSIVHENNDVRTFDSVDVFELRIILIREEDGGYSATARDLPGVASQGDSLGEAIENIREAFIGAIEYYRENSQEIPWSLEPAERPANAEERWILIDG